MHQRLDIARALSESARAMDSPPTLEATLDAIVRAARDAIPGADHVGVSVALSDGRMITRAATHELVHRLDQLQYQTGGGPCVYAMRGQGVVVLEHLDREERWPDYLPRARALGLRSQLGVQLFSDSTSLGGLNLFSTTSDSLPGEARDLAELFAVHAGMAFNRTEATDEVYHSVRTREVIGQATGVLMQRHRLTAGQAFEFLTRASLVSDLSLREIAVEIVQDVGRRRTGEAGPAAPPG